MSPTTDASTDGTPQASTRHVLHVMEATIGGTRRHLRDVAGVQAEAGHRVTVVAAAERMPEVRDDLAGLAQRGVHTIELPMQRSIRPVIDWRHLRALQTILREAMPDVVHTHSSKAGALGRLASLNTGIGARVHTPHTFAFLFDAMFSPAKRRLFRSIETYLGRRTHRIVAVGPGEAETIARSGVVDPARVRVVPNAIDATPYREARPLARAELDVPKDAFLVATIGLLNVAKGQDLAIEALAGPGLERVILMLVGHGEQEQELRRLARANDVESRVRFLGWRGDVPRLLATCDLCLLPSRWEGMPYVVLEAMAAGRAVLATRVDGARDLVRDGTTGRLVEPGSADAIGRALAELASLPLDELKALGRAGRARVEAEYDLETMRRALDAVYDEALEARARRAKSA